MKRTPIGAMDQRITLQRVTRTQDEYGGNVEAWSDICTVWAHVKPLAGREMLDAGRVSPVTRYRAVIWWKGDENGAPFYTAADRVIWHGREYAIEGVVPLGRNDRMELRLVEGAVT